MAQTPIVALVGRPNVGKSTLFNRLIGERLAIVEDLPGTTRDRLYGEAEWAGVPFIVVDTGGLADDPTDTILTSIRAQAEVAMDEADVIVFLVDAVAGLTASDSDVANRLRLAKKPVLVAVNKADNAARRQDAVEFFELGLGEPMPISALHGTGTGDLLDRVVENLPVTPEDEEDETIKIAIVGRPNVGKSSLLNRMLGEERSIVSDIPGTTRDAIDTQIRYEGQDITLIDTAGIRRRGRIEQGIEKYSVLRSMRAIQRADVSLLLLDAPQGITAQDAHVAGYILEEGKSVVVIVNKWDLLEKDSSTLNEYAAKVRRELNFLDYVPVLFISAKTGQRVNQVLPTALRVYEARFQRIATAELNRLLRDATSHHAPPTKSGQRLKFYYGTQVAVDPPRFVFFVNDHRLVHFTYERYLENLLRERYVFEGTPIRITFRTREREDHKAKA
ncbi:MAG: ribosome biogenesis GTPase Der [Anaerolineae bacterium]|nr:ribosome biogenesis GTPase Der [Anaerolineae bacterium]